MEIERSAASVEEAIEGALQELGVSEQEAQIEIVQEPRAGLLGLRSQPAIVRVRVLAGPTSEEAPDDEQEEIAFEFLRGLLAAMELQVELEVNVVDGVRYMDIWGSESSEDMGLLIGKRGHTVEALQELMRAAVQREGAERCRIQVDVEDYRKRRRAQLIDRAREAARRVRKTGKPEALEPMSSYERKIVHDAVAEIMGLETGSEGEEPERRVVIRRKL
jgi:spoIIIJ-associated protein